MGGKAAATASSSSSTKAVEAPQQTIVNFDSLEDLEINLQSNVDQLVKMIVPKLKEASAKQASSKFLNDTLKSLTMKLTLPETEQLHKVVKEMHTKRKKADQAAKKKELEEEDRKKKEEAIPKQQVADDDFFAAFM